MSGCCTVRIRCSLSLQSVSHPELGFGRDTSVCQLIDQRRSRNKDPKFLLTHSSNAFRKLLVSREMNVSEFCNRVTHDPVNIPGKFAGLDVRHRSAKVLTRQWRPSIVPRGRQRAG